MKWHTHELSVVFKSLSATEVGLTQDEANRRLQQYGPNRLPEQPPPSLAKIVFHQFLSPLIYVLFIAAVISLFIGDLKDVVFIMAVLILNAVIGAYQEWKAEKSSQALRNLLRIRASVLRDGLLKEIPSEELVPGDIVELESGNRVPADIRLLSVHSFQVDESLLTGESLSVAKDPKWVGQENAPVGDRANMAYAGTIVVRGRAKGIVVATGAATNIGKISVDVLRTAEGKPPLIERMEQFTQVIVVATIVIALFIGIVGIFVGSHTPGEMLLFIIALAVSVVPEGLPVAITVALAVATTRLAWRGVIVRRLTAVEGLGSCTLIAADKTGTLTVNELTVKEITTANGERFHIEGHGFIPEGHILKDQNPIDPKQHPSLEYLARAGVLCNEADLHKHRDGWRWRGDAVDVAFLVLGHKMGCQKGHGIGRYPLLNKIPFESELRYAATFYDYEGKIYVFVKGAPERVLKMCQGGEKLLEWESTAWEMASRGLRVLALAEGVNEKPEDGLSEFKEPKNLTFLGLVGMIDPLRSDAKEAVQTCLHAGVRVVMITGDHKITAFAIARELNLVQDENQVMTGQDLSEITIGDLASKLENTNVFARVSPHQKLQIVEAAQRTGNFVAATGDGVNDAPALRAANIGVAMGKGGTDVAREAAELVISDDKFSSIVSGIEEGRIAYDNIRKVIFLLISTGATELVVMGLAVANAFPLPLLPVQILWLNLVTNGIQHVGLAFDPGEKNVLMRKPRPPQERIFNKLMIERTLVAALTAGMIGFALFDWLVSRGWEISEARNILLLYMVLFENFHIGNCLSETISTFKLSPLRRPLLLGGTIGALLVHVAAMHIPLMQDVLGVQPVSLLTWAAVAFLAALIVPVMEIQKIVWRIRQS